MMYVDGYSQSTYIIRPTAINAQIFTIKFKDEWVASLRPPSQLHLTSLYFNKPKAVTLGSLFFPCAV